MNDSECANQLRDIKVLLNKVFGVLNGDNDDGGLVTRVALIEQKIADLPSPNELKFYASVGGGVVLVLALFGYAMVKLITQNWGQ